MQKGAGERGGAPDGNAAMPPREIDLALHRALEDANDKTVRDLLSRKADPNAPTVGGRSALDISIEKDSVSLSRILLVYQADPENVSDGAQGKSEACELIRSWAQGDVPTVFDALEEVVLDAACMHDVSLLGLALASMDIAGGDAEQVAALVDERHNTLLHLCAKQEGQVELRAAEAAARLTARLLLGWGVPVDGRNEKDETALLLAMRAMHFRTRGRAGAGNNTFAVPSEPARALLEARADVETVDPLTRETLLMQAAKEGNLAACKLLLEHRADPLRQNAQSQNAINLCSHRPEVAVLLRSSLVRRNGEMQDASPAYDPSRANHSPIVHEDSFVTPLPKEISVSISSEVEFHKMNDQDLDQDLGSMQGILNQVDLEESYESLDWGNVEGVLEKAAEGDWDHVRPVVA